MVFGAFVRKNFAVDAAPVFQTAVAFAFLVRVLRAHVAEGDEGDLGIADNARGFAAVSKHDAIFARAGERLVFRRI